MSTGILLFKLMKTVERRIYENERNWGKYEIYSSHQISSQACVSSSPWVDSPSGGRCRSRHHLPYCYQSRLGPNRQRVCQFNVVHRNILHGLVNIYHHHHDPPERK